MSKIWFTSDTHYNHKNLCLGVSSWSNKHLSARKFDTLEEMNKLIVKNINDVVEENDILYHLGDWSFGGIENIWEFKKQINCKNVYLVPGNHDHHVKNNKPMATKWIRYFNGPIDQWYEWKDNFKTKKECLEACNKDSFYEPHQHDYNYPQDIFTKVLPELTKIVIDKKEIILSHFPLEEWENMDRGSYHLHGHSHHTKDYADLNMYHRRIDVGLDWEKFRPYSWEEIKEIMETRIIKARHENN